MEVDVSNISTLKRYISELNEKQEILNENLFGPFKADDTIIAIQVHDKIHYFNKTIDGLSKVKGIEKTLLIFSHSIFHPEINRIVKNIKFAKVMQIFYPNSTQLYPKTFPGDDPNDCPRDTPKLEAIKMNCNSAEFPDKYGHYRESKLTQLKHHWFWKLNFIFGRLRITTNFEGYVVLLEDDYYLIPDSLYVLEKMRKLIIDDSNCVYSLGIREYKIDATKTNVVVNFSGVPLNSHIFSKNFWNAFKKYSENFCTYDNYHLDFSFIGVTHEFMKPPPFSIYPLVPRVFHIGSYGVNNHDPKRYNYYQVQKDLLQIKHNLFPKYLKVEFENDSRTYIQEWGGFNDPRDKQLCLSFIL
ncbi:alpha-1:6-mannosyl-glycoprotein 2-beta-N-acetylglucosaminyltransferase-like isoform X2 [Leptotrombidium deliense]|uniref:Alpha-1,6-mannosyl-glycoprotein 2-beta-N-acetylglucosaminyltransferase n=1 Tax=Leptotrombidium deliense TaxID=299467 RepID=A0A443S182_9ACAR|nr:alpha-1:6-mannosyl-glycoprotein 2-beta-N-acetylglucosaminyltransferase-like isoform X2 [Leptotrombidium deliense]